jgi:polar amino acid transport system substrate-binding protein
VTALPARVVFAYIDEPPFAQPGPQGAEGCDAQLALQGLRAIGVEHVDPVLTTFSELLPGLQDGRWHMTTALFITPERARHVDFSQPIWALADGLVLRKDDASRLGDLAALVHAGARLAVVRGQVQAQAALAAGLPPAQLHVFESQDEAVDALLAEDVDAYMSTALGNRTYIARRGDARLQAVPLPAPRPPQGAFCFARDARPLRQAFDGWLAAFLGSAQHLELAARWGLGAQEVGAAALA